MRSAIGFIKGALAAGVVTVLSQAAWAIDITINDGLNSSGTFGTDKRGLKEDQEVEPNTVTGQIWDLEAFVVQNNRLYVIGGFNFLSGQSGSGQTFKSGDIFIDTDGDAKWGTRAPVIGGGNGYRTLNNNAYLYNYVIDLNFVSAVNSTYAVHALNDAPASLLSVYYRQNDESNPYRYVSGAQQENIARGTLEYRAGLTDAQVASEFGVTLAGGKHNVVGIDMSWFSDQEILTHFSIACGNDNLMGEVSGGFDVPDSSSTLIMLGFVLTAMAGVGRRFKK